jgi:nitrite reductase/ring-hydroxylating ferredoxin subunit
VERTDTTYIVEDRAAGLFRVNRRAFTDPQCLEEERARLFGSCWIYVGHESEVPHAGDYIARTVAGRPMILVRGDDQVIRLLLNTCTHRGALKCRQKSGNANTFQCPYHAWTFNLRGRLIGVPGEASYSEAFSRDELRLVSPARVEAYRGFIFACLDPAADSLYDYLADAREYLDLVVEVGTRNENRSGPAILQFASQLEIAGRKQFRRIPRNGSPSAIFRLPQRRWRGHEELRRASAGARSRQWPRGRGI